MQLVSNITNLGALRRVDLDFCVDIEYLLSTIALASSHPHLIGRTCRHHTPWILERKAINGCNTFTFTSPEAIVKRKLRMNMKNLDGGASMRKLFIGYHMLLRSYNLSWDISYSEKGAIQYVLRNIHVASLRARLETYLAISHTHIRKNFEEEFKHEYKINTAFAIDDGRVLLDSKIWIGLDNTWLSRQTRENGKI